MKAFLVTTIFLTTIGTSIGYAYEVGDIIDDFTLPNLDGQDSSLHDQLGGIVVLNFFATWCVGCNEEAERLENDVWQIYQDRNVSVIAIDIQEPLSLVQGWAAALEVTYHIWLAPDWDLFQEFPGALNIPYNAVIGPDMELRYASIGFDLNAITSMVDTILAEGQVPVVTTGWGNIKALFR